MSIDLRPDATVAASTEVSRDERPSRDDGIDFDVELGRPSDDGAVPLTYRFASVEDAIVYDRILSERAFTAIARAALSLAGGSAAPTKPVEFPNPRRVTDHAPSDYYDQYSSPLPKRRFLDLARQGAFPCAKVGKQRLVRRSDFDAYIANRAVHLIPRTRVVELPDDTDDLLARVGVRRVKP